MYHEPVSGTALAANALLPAAPAAAKNPLKITRFISTP